MREKTQNHIAFEKNEQIVRKFSDPKAMADHLEEHTKHFAKAAPNITTGLNTAVMTGQQFLQSKIPQDPNPLPLSKPYRPSKAEMSKYNQYYDVLNDPISVLHHVKNGTLKGEHLEAMQAVFPSLLNEMKSKVMEHMDPEKARKLPYRTKLSLASFFGQPLDGSMLGQSIAANQAALSGPSLSGNTSIQQKTKSSLGGLKMLNESERTATQTNSDFDEKKD